MLFNEENVELELGFELTAIEMECTPTLTRTLGCHIVTTR
jgi:hypothetical protein